MNKDNNLKQVTAEKNESSEVGALKNALASKDKELEQARKQAQKKEEEKKQLNQVLKDEEEKNLLRKYGFDASELENVRLLSQGEITEIKLRELKQKAVQKRTNAFISLLQDEEINYHKEEREPWVSLMKFIDDHPKSKIR